MKLLKIARTYAGMLERCYQESSRPYSDYGGRGILVCDEWMNNPGSFFTWCMSQGDISGLHLDRLDNNRGYSPDNCAFVSPRENVRNRRNTLFLVAWNESKPMAAWAEDGRAGAGVSYQLIYNRVATGWSPEDAVSKPSKVFKNISSETTVSVTRQGVHPSDPTYEFQGEIKTLAEWAKDGRAAVSASIMWDRINKNGWDFERALTQPTAANRGLLFEGKTINEWFKHPDCKISYNTLANRLKSGMTVKEAFSTPAVRGRRLT
jgi:hypothetical protein